MKDFCVILIITLLLTHLGVVSWKGVIPSVDFETTRQNAIELLEDKENP